MAFASPGIELSRNDSGILETVNVNGRTDTRRAFFQSLGSNARSCATCHAADQAMTISPPQIQQRYNQTNGSDPLFASVDGANCANVRAQDRSGHRPVAEARTHPHRDRYRKRGVHDFRGT